VAPTDKQQCRVCGCTDDNCRDCIKRTGRACSWVMRDLCSACASPSQALIQDLAAYLAQALNAPGAMLVVLDRQGGLHIGSATEAIFGEPLKHLRVQLDNYVKELMARAAAGVRTREVRRG
jgi:hypothetical protein